MDIIVYTRLEGQSLKEKKQEILLFNLVNLFAKFDSARRKTNDTKLSKCQAKTTLAFHCRQHFTVMRWLDLRLVDSISIRLRLDCRSIATRQL